MIAKETRQVLFALNHNPATLAKQAKVSERNPDETRKYPDIVIADSEYDAIEIPNFEASVGSVKVIVEARDKDIQKTGIICPDCYKPTDFVIWGKHK